MLNTTTLSGFAFWSSAARIPSKKQVRFIDPVPGSHRFEHGAIGAGQVDLLYGMGFGTAGGSNSGGSGGLHILGYTESCLD
jgi:hypothetical protein